MDLGKVLQVTAKCLILHIDIIGGDLGTSEADSMLQMKTSDENVLLKKQIKASFSKSSTFLS